MLHQSCRQLKAIQIEYPNTEIFTNFLGLLSTPQPYWSTDLAAFQNLQSLTLNQIGGNLRAWQAHIVKILLQSPTLKELSLSLCAMAIYVGHFASIYDVLYFDRLCDSYAKAGGAPLKLRSLKCGQAMMPMSLASLVKLTDLQYLEEADICNRNVAFRGEEIHSFYPTGQFTVNNISSGIAYEAFGPKHSPNLRRLSIHRYGPDVGGLLFTIADDKVHSRRLALCVGGLGAPNSTDPAAFFTPNPGRRGLHMQLRMFAVEVSRRRLEDLILSEALGTGRPSILDMIASSTADSLEGLAVHMLDEPGHEWATKFLRMSVLESALGKLPRLTQLLFNPFVADKLGQHMSPGVVFAAHRLAAAGPALAYIGMYRQFWRVNRHPSDGSPFQLEALEEKEWREVELFEMASWNYDHPE